MEEKDKTTNVLSYADRIKPDGVGIISYLDGLLRKRYQIPTFQRSVEWKELNVKKLWDSMYKFYPIGSILIWLTGLKLERHRAIGGHIIDEEGFSRTEYQYLLDGQQRTTALLTSIYGGEIEGRKDFDPILYVDLTIKDKSATDDASFKSRFLFWDEIDDAKVKRNKARKERFDAGLIIKLKDIKERYGQVEERIQKHPDYNNYNAVPRVQLRRIKEVLDNYRISLIELRGIRVSEVCQIFERINVEGKPLDIFDIVVAKTYQPSNKGNGGFYLRELIDEFKQINDSNFMDIDYLTYLQILAVLINKKAPDSGIQNITNTYLSKLKKEQIEQVWNQSQAKGAKAAILKTFDFFENHLKLKGPHLIPYRYFYMTIASYFFENSNPNYDLLKHYFWYYSFHRDDLLTNTTDLWKNVNFLQRVKIGKEQTFERFMIDKEDLRSASYSSKGRYSRAILSLFSNQDPKDWRNQDRSVWSEVYYSLVDKPNLHHVFPLDYIKHNPGLNKLNSNSLMNIVYLTQITNLEISNDNPVSYIKNFDNSTFKNTLSRHLVPENILEWGRQNKAPANALDEFIEGRVVKIIDKLKEKIGFADSDIIDTR